MLCLVAAVCHQMGFQSSPACLQWPSFLCHHCGSWTYDADSFVAERRCVLILGRAVHVLHVTGIPDPLCMTHLCSDTGHSWLCSLTIFSMLPTTMCACVGTQPRQEGLHDCECGPLPRAAHLWQAPQPPHLAVQLAVSPVHLPVAGLSQVTRVI